MAGELSVRSNKALGLLFNLISKLSTLDYRPFSEDFFQKQQPLSYFKKFFQCLPFRTNI